MPNLSWNYDNEVNILTSTDQKFNKIMDKIRRHDISFQEMTENERNNVISFLKKISLNYNPEEKLVEEVYKNLCRN